MGVLVYRDICIDFSKSRYIILDAKQHDSKSRYIRVTCTNLGEKINLTKNNFLAFIRYKKPDGNGVFNKCVISTEGKIIFELTEQMLSTVGTSCADLIIIDPSKSDIENDFTILNSAGDIVESNYSIVSTMSFFINVIDKPINDEKIISTNEFSALNELLIKATKDYNYIIEATGDYVNDALHYADEARSYAVGTGGVRPNESIDNAKKYYEQAKEISESLSGALRPMGTVTFSNLPSLSTAIDGDMYNIYDQFITNDDFQEGGGVIIPAGSNIYKTVTGKWDVLAGSPVTGIKGDMESSYRKGNVNLTANDIGAFGDCGTAADGTDLNTLITSGMYFFMAARNYTNMPPNVTNGLMLVYRYGTMCKQIFLRYGSPNSNDSDTYIRMIINAGNTNASATSWQKFSVDQEIASKYLPKTGGTLTGTLLGTTIIGNQIQIKNTERPQALIVRTDSNGNTIRAGMMQISPDNNLGIWDVTNSKWMCYSSLDGTNVRFLGKADDSYKADTATKATQDGSGNIISSTYLKRSGGTIAGTLYFGNDEKSYIFSAPGKTVVALSGNFTGQSGISTGAQLSVCDRSVIGTSIIASSGQTNTTTLTLGTANDQWGQFYSTNSTISTSDRNMKHDISYVGQDSEYDTAMTDDQLEDFIMGLMACVYRLNDGTSGRPHHGFIAQDIEDLMQKIGITDHAGFIKSPKMREIEVTVGQDKNGNEIKELHQEEIPEEFIYSLRYEEFISDIIRFVQIQKTKVDNLEKRLTLTEQKNLELNEKIEVLERAINI